MQVTVMNNITNIICFIIGSLVTLTFWGYKWYKTDFSK